MIPMSKMQDRKPLESFFRTSFLGIISGNKMGLPFPFKKRIVSRIQKPTGKNVLQDVLKKSSIGIAVV